MLTDGESEEDDDEEDDDDDDDDEVAVLSPPSTSSAGSLQRSGASRTVVHRTVASYFDVPVSLMSPEQRRYALIFIVNSPKRLIHVFLQEI